MKRVLLLTLLCLPCAAPLYADVKVPSIISDHMVLQRSARTPIWGTAAPGEEVRVALGSVSGQTRAGADGKWRVNLDLEKADQGPLKLTVHGTNEVAVSDVVVGDVWLASGQSNMEFPLSRTAGAAEEIARSANPMFRQFLVKINGAPKPLDDCEGKWEAASPEASGRFTAIGYFFGKTIQQKRNIPVGLINASYGGSLVEAWISPAGFDQDKELKAAKEKMCGEAESYPQRLKDFTAQYHAWAAKYAREDHASPDAQQFAAPNIPLEGWKPVTLPGSLSKANLPDSGAIWLRKTVTIPPGMANMYMPLRLSAPRDFDTVYLNGVKVGETTPEASTSANFEATSNNDRRYDVPGNQVKAGEATIAIRLYSPGGDAGVGNDRSNLYASGLKLNGEWLAKPEAELPPLSAEAKAAYPQRPLTPPQSRAMATALFNAMIHPIVPYGIKGVIWYQGESNAGRGFQYRTAFQMLIQDWRAQWQQGEVPFYFCQLPNFMAKQTAPGNSGWAELREAQSMALKLPNTGQAVLIDLGEEGDVHPRNKTEAGERLAQVALAKTYGQPVAWAGPVYRSMQIEGGKIRLRLESAQGLTARALPTTYQPKSGDPATKPLVLNSPGSELQGFTVCGSDRKFVWANAKIEGDSILVWAPEVASPVAVRYAWADNPTCNLYNKAGLPAAPFRTDDFPLTSLAGRYGQ